MYTRLGIAALLHSGEPRGIAQLSVSKSQKDQEIGKGSFRRAGVLSAPRWAPEPGASAGTQSLQSRGCRRRRLCGAIQEVPALRAVPAVWSRLEVASSKRVRYRHQKEVLRQ